MSTGVGSGAGATLPAGLFNVLPPPINDLPSRPTMSISAPCRAFVCPILPGFNRGSSTPIGTVWFLPTDLPLVYFDFTLAS